MYIYIYACARVELVKTLRHFALSLEFAGNCQNVEFTFDQSSDTAWSVANEMKQELRIVVDVDSIAEQIQMEIDKLTDISNQNEKASGRLHKVIKWASLETSAQISIHTYMCMKSLCQWPSDVLVV